jgi:hypothetical protein
VLSQEATEVTYWTLSLSCHKPYFVIIIIIIIISVIHCGSELKTPASRERVRVLIRINGSIFMGRLRLSLAAARKQLTVCTQAHSREIEQHYAAVYILSTAAAVRNATAMAKWY